MTTLPLIRHPSVPAPYVHGVTVNVHSPAAGWYILEYRITGDVDELQLAPKAPSRPVDELWKHTCLEAFIGASDRAEYFELNFSPSTEWAVYRFDAYRQGMRAITPARAPSIVCTTHAGGFDVDVEVQLEALEEFRGEALRMGLSAVIQDRSGQMSYWALAHPGGKPDFHHADSFTLNPSHQPR